MGELTEFIVNLQKSKEARSTRKNVSMSLNIGNIYGRLTIKDMTRLKGHGIITYRCTCECGNEVDLTHHEVKRRAILDQGCMEFDCSVHADIAIDKLPIGNMEGCLLDQFRRMIAYHGGQTCEDWGGSDSHLDMASALENFTEFMQELGATKDNGYWMAYRIDNRRPYEPGNVDVGRVDKMSGVSGEHVFLYENNLISVEEAAEIFGCEIEDIITLQDAMISDDDICESFS